MKTAFNKYGDQLIKTTGLHGADISSQRMDDLDKKALKYVFENYEKNLRGIDAGCGFGIQSIRFALLNAEMHLYDILDIDKRIKTLSESLFIKNKLFYTKKNLKKIAATDLPSNVDFMYSQRFIHYLTYPQASDFVAIIRQVIKKNSFIFLSASGIHSELGTNYKGTEHAVEKRYFKLSPAMALKHNILEKVCLYSKEDMSVLLTQNQFKVKEIWESAFGNIKVIAVKQ